MQEYRAELDRLTQQLNRYFEEDERYEREREERDVSHRNANSGRSRPVTPQECSEWIERRANIEALSSRLDELSSRIDKAYVRYHESLEAVQDSSSPGRDHSIDMDLIEEDYIDRDNMSEYYY
jgi:hypothetical protein